MGKYDVVLLEKPETSGLTQMDCMELFAKMTEEEFYPLEVLNPASESAAMGFIGVKAAETINYEFSGLNLFVGQILADMEKETEDGTYVYQSLNISLLR